MLGFVASRQSYHADSQRCTLPTPSPLVPTVSQLQQTLVSIQELLVQQQQKIQELSRELSAAEVTSLDHLNQT